MAKFISQRVKVLVFPENPVRAIAHPARVCYKSLPKDIIQEIKFVNGLKKSGHLTPFEHVSATVELTTSRAVTHELVRHRVASFAQESTRYCNYSKDKFGNQLTFIIPEFFQYGSPAWKVWKDAMECAEAYYLTLINMGVKPEEARTVLPNSLKTEVIMTANCAEWKHFFNLRACNSTGKAHPQMLEVSRPLLDDFKNTISEIFDDLVYGE